MSVTTSRANGAAIVRVDAPRLTHPTVSDFATSAGGLIASGEKRLVVDLGAVTYVDSVAIGCLMDLYKQATAAGGTIKLAGLQKRVETMLTMAGAHHIIEVYADAAAAVASFGG
jgi:anti-anti-sigma factor